MLLKQILWKDRNLLFSLSFQGLIYFISIGVFDIFGIYCITVLNIEEELFLSNIYCSAMFALFVYQMIGFNANFFTNHSNDEEGPKVKTD